MNNNKSSGSFFSDLKEFISPYKMKYAMSVVISMLGVLCNMLSYAAVGNIAGRIFSGEKEFSEVAGEVILAAVLKILYGILINISTWVSHRAAFNTLMDIRLALTDKMLKLPLGYFEENGTGRLKTTIVDRVESVEKTLAHLLPEMTANILIPLIMIVWSFIIDWRVSLCMLIWFVIGLCLSGGEKQRISIARAILKDAPIVILDEAASALDAENEKSIIEAIDRLTENKTETISRVLSQKAWILWRRIGI